MGRAKLSVENIRRHTYVCEDHFDEGVVLDYRLVRYHKCAENWSFLKFIHAYPRTTQALDRIVLRAQWFLEGLKFG